MPGEKVRKINDSDMNALITPSFYQITLLVFVL